jgi:hypothetical protein
MDAWALPGFKVLILKEEQGSKAPLQGSERENLIGSLGQVISPVHSPEASKG